MTPPGRRWARAAGTDSGAEGSALIMVLVFVTVFGIIVAATLDLASAGLTISRQVTGLRDTHLAVESAVDGAINSLRNSNQLGRTGTEGLCGDFVQPANGTDPEVVVTCEPEPATDDQPAFAVIALGVGANEGFRKTGSNNILTVEGGVFSHSGITNTTTGAVQVVGDAVARGTCSGSVIATSFKLCPITPSGASYPTGDDPAYPAAVPLTGASISAMAKDPAPVCASGNQVVRFSPGLYSERPGLLLELASLPCENARFWWFSPGVYYFDFPDDDATWDPSDEEASVIGGTPRGWSPTGAAPTAGTIPGACDPDPTQPGVQFIFGGRSTLVNDSDNTNHEVELCAGTSASTNQKIAVYGLCPTVGAAAGCEVGTRATVGPTDLLGTSASAQGQFPNGSAGNALAVGGGSVVGLFPPNTSGTVTVGGFPTIPGGSHLVNVEVEIRHSETGNSGAVGALNVGSTVTTASGDTFLCGSSPGPNRVDRCNLTSFLADDKVDAAELNGLTVRFGANRGSGGPSDQAATVSLDSIVLRAVTYLAPGFEPHRCATNPSPGDPPTCSLLEGLDDPTISVHGTIYAPSAAIRVNVSNETATLFRRGIVARHIGARTSGPSNHTNAPFQLASTTATRQVLLTAHVGGVAKLAARVRYHDIDLAGPGPADDTAIPGARVEILDWVVVR